MPDVRVASGTVCLAFEGYGRVSTRNVFDRLVLRAPGDMDALWQQVREELEPLGFRGVETVQLRLPLGQGNRDLHVVVVVRLRGLASFEEGLRSIGRRMPSALKNALERLCRGATYSQRIDRVRPQGWTFIED